MQVLCSKPIRRVVGVLILLSALGVWYTTRGLRPLPASLLPTTSAIHKVQVLDRHGTPLSVTYHNPWNVHAYVPLHAIPPLLQQAFLLAEDRRFYQHHGVDWLARAKALGQNLWARRVVRDLFEAYLAEPGLLPPGWTDMAAECLPRWRRWTRSRPASPRYATSAPGASATWPCARPSTRAKSSARGWFRRARRWESPAGTAT